MAQTYKYQIVGDTQPAVKGNEALDASINKVDASTKQLQKDLGKTSVESNKAFGAELETKIKTTDAKIKTISGTVGLLTGALSTAIGALGLFGIEDEQIAGFQKATLSVLALGAGAAQAITGVKDLFEARKLTIELNNASTVAENQNTVALVANADAAAAVTVSQNAATTSILGEKTATDKNTISKGINTAATITETTATEGLTLAKRAELLVTKALDAARKLSIGGWIAIGVAIYTVVSALTQWLSSSKNEEGQLKTNNELRKEQLQLLKDVNREYLDSNERLKALEAGAKARNRTVLEEAKAEKQRAQDAIDRANKELALIREGNTLGRTTLEDTKDQIEAVQIRKDEAQKYYDSVVEGEKLYLENTKKTNEENAKRNKQLRDERLEREGLLQVIRLEINEFIEEVFPEFKDKSKDTIFDPHLLMTVEQGLNSIKTVVSEIDFNELEDFTFLSQEQLDILKRLRGELDTGLKQQLFTREQQYKDELALFVDNEEAKKQLTEEYEKDKDKIRRQYAVQTFQTILGVAGNYFRALEELNSRTLELELAQAQGNQIAINAINKKAFEDNKKLKLASAYITTAEAALNGYNSASTLPVPFNFIVGGVLAALYAGIGAKTIQTISATQYGGGGGTSSPSSRPSFGGFSLPGGGGVPVGIPGAQPGGALLPGLGGGRIGVPTIGTIGQEPVRAYVLAGDVTNGVQANVALNNRRRLTG